VCESKDEVCFTLFLLGEKLYCGQYKKTLLVPDLLLYLKWNNNARNKVQLKVNNF